MILLFNGCAGPAVKQVREPIFYPALPEEPRIQYISSFGSSKDFEDKPSWLTTFIVGEDQSNQPIAKPYGVTIRNGSVYICDTVTNTLDMLDLRKKTFSYFKVKGSGGELVTPVNLDISKDGTIFIADSGRGQ
ncbi:MAG: hypothetical protein Q8Q33_03410, partial [Chlamydiota bacterium]|nr:hypothetical protein [Chlamydiota bacterium]